MLALFIDSMQSQQKSVCGGDLLVDSKIHVEMKRAKNSQGNVEEQQS